MTREFGKEMLAGEDGIQHFTPAYDLLCTRLVLPNDTLALPIRGRKDNFQRSTWLKFADDCEIPRKAAERVLDEQTRIFEDATKLIDRCFLPDEQKSVYQRLIEERTNALR